MGRYRERAISDAYLVADGGGERVPNSRKSDMHESIATWIGEATGVVRPEEYPSI